MNNLTKSSKLFLFISLSALALWLGGYLVRQLVMYQFFEPDGLSLRIIYNLSNIPAVLVTISPILVFNIISFTIFLISFIFFLFISKVKLKNEGWLFISLIIISITAPFEIFLLFKDYDIISGILWLNSQPDIIVELIKQRMIVFSSFSLIEIFSYLSIIFLFIFKPLRRTNEN